MKKLIDELKKNENVRSNLSGLRKVINDEGGTEVLLSYFSVEELLKFLDDEDAKTRKNAALLLFDIADGIKEKDEVAKALVDKYFIEDKLFIKSSFLKALKKYPIDEYREKLTNRKEELFKYIPDENEKKHILEERKELDALLADENTSKKHVFTGYDIKQEVILVTNPLYYETFSAKLHNIRTKKHPFGMAVMSENLKQLLPLRYYREILFTQKLGKEVSINDTPEAIADALIEGKLVDKIKERHKDSDTPFKFRMEIKGAGGADFTKLIKRVAMEIEQKSGYVLKNSTSDYELIIRLIADRNGKIHAFIKYLTIADKRFLYRKNSIASSIHPANAALLMELASPYFKDNAQAIDPCCGVGTMLVERNKIKPLREIYAIDTFGEAIDKAKENTALAGMEINFIHRDFLDFTHDYPFDEVIANMPVRGKKTKEEQDAFYSGFFDKCAQIMAPGGIMILYSNEKSFIFKQLRIREKFSLVKEFVIRERDGFGLYIIRYS